MYFKKAIKMIALPVLASTILIGCGGGSSTSTNGGTSGGTIGGTIAIGAGIYAQVDVLDTQTCQTFTSYSDSSGIWTSGDLSGSMGPYLIKASSSIGFNMYSYVDVNSSRTVNVTPLTYYVTDAAARVSAGRSIVSMYSSCNDGVFEGLSGFDSFETEMNTSLNNLNTRLRSGGHIDDGEPFNHFNDPFSANNEGYDAVLDGLDMSLNNNATFIRIDGEILETLDEEITGESTQTIASKVVDSSGNALSDVSVLINKDDLMQTEVTTLTSDSLGEYSTDLEKYREYNIIFSKDGYTSTSLKYNSFEDDVNPVQIVLFTEAETLEASTVSPSIEISNSRTGDTISNVEINVRSGYNNRSGATLMTIDTAENSTLSLVPGLYTFELKKDGYEHKFQNQTVTSSSSMLSFDMLSTNSSSSLNDDAFATIILRWGENPEDIDSHTLLTVNESEVDVYYAEPQYGGIPEDRENPCATDGVIASLDLDDVDSYGPETTTICDGTKGPFTFKVHHYSGTSDIGSSPTSVELITRDGSRYEFNAPISGFSGNDDDVWNVFTLNSNQSIERINTITSDGEDLEFHGIDNLEEL